MQTNEQGAGWYVAMGTYWRVSVAAAGPVAGVKAYLISLRRTPHRPHKLHDGHEHGNNEATDEDHEDPSDVLHAQTWDTHTHLL